MPECGCAATKAEELGPTGLRPFNFEVVDVTVSIQVAATT